MRAQKAYRFAACLRDGGYFTVGKICSCSGDDWVIVHTYSPRGLILPGIQMKLVCSLSRMHDWFLDVTIPDPARLMRRGAQSLSTCHQILP